MLVDHFALFYFPHAFPLQVIGRLSYPLIAWLIANGAIYTSNIDVYLGRLAFFAVLAQVPYEIGFYMHGTHPLFFNVLFTLFFGLLAIRLIQRASNPMLGVLGAGACVVLASVLHTDYGAGGVLSILAFYVFYNRPLLMVASQIFILSILTNLRFFIAPGFGNAFVMHPFEKYAALALPLILLYNNKRGPMTGYFFYWFFVAQNFAMLLLVIASSANR